MVYGKRANKDDRDESQISEADWEATPASVKKVVEALMRHHEVEPTNNIAERTLRPAVI
jgi:hypothetical protein